MKFSQISVAGIVLLGSGCQSSDYHEGPFASPSQAYSVKANVNRTDKAKPAYASVQLILFDAAGHKIDSVDNRASDFSKWALGWMPQGDTIVLHSSDVGASAWCVTSLGRLKKIELSSISATTRARINARAAELKALKYK